MFRNEFLGACQVLVFVVVLIGFRALVGCGLSFGFSRVASTFFASEFKILEKVLKSVSFWLFAASPGSSFTALSLFVFSFSPAFTALVWLRFQAILADSCVERGPPGLGVAHIRVQFRVPIWVRIKVKKAVWVCAMTLVARWVLPAFQRVQAVSSHIPIMLINNPHLRRQIRTMARVVTLLGLISKCVLIIILILIITKLVWVGDLKSWSREILSCIGLAEPESFLPGDTPPVRALVPPPRPRVKPKLLLSPSMMRTFEVTVFGLDPFGGVFLSGESEPVGMRGEGLVVDGVLCQSDGVCLLSCGVDPDSLLED